MSCAAKRKPRAVSIRWKLATVLAVFIALVLIVTWIFQFYLLNLFYEHVKRRELEQSANVLAQSLGDEDLAMLAYSHAVDCTMTVSIYRIEQEKTNAVVNVDATGQTGVLYPEQHLEKYYASAMQNGGVYVGQFVFGGFEVNKQEEDRFPGGGGWNSPPNHAQNVRLVHVQIAEDAKGVQHLIILNAGLQPLDSTVQTLKTQYIWIIYILVFGAGTMVFFLYRYISAPLVRMNESAKKLALGNYDVEFSGKGYRESIELAETLNYASRELSRLDRLQKELIANISHDLRTPLTMIKGYSEVMRDLPGENTPENMQVVIDETTRLSELVNDLLDLSRIQSGVNKPNLEAFDLSTALQETMNRYETLIRHKGYHIHLTAGDAAWVYADRGMILQVIYNLINNAINYTGEDQTVVVTQEIVAQRVRVSVTDTGEGIEPDKIPLVWDRYYKVDKVHRRAMIGTGLGLSIVKEILELHNAVYGVQSTVGKGSTFWFEIPVIPSPNLSENNRED